MDRFRTQISAVRDLLLSLSVVVTRKRLKHWAYALCFGFGLLIPWIGMQFQGIPAATTPLAHARMLAAETFASGRWANPPLIGGFFFQTYQTIQEPGYAAAIPPGASLLLTAGVWLSDPLLGLWLTSALFSLLTAWMLKAFASLRWAIIGSLFVTLWFGWLSYWSQSFDGSAATACGIALTWGAAKRYQIRRQGLYALLLGVGVGWTLLCDPLAAYFALPVPLLLASRAWWRQRALLALAAFCSGLGICAAIQASFNHATTGSVLKSPQSLYRERYNAHPIFLWQPRERPPVFDFPRMEEYDLLVNERASILPPPVGKLWLGRITECLLFYAGWPALLIVVGGAWLGLSRWARWYVAGAGVALSSTVLVLPFDRSIAAGLACVVPLLLVFCLRQLWIFREKRGLGTWKLSGAIAMLLFLATWARGLDFTKDAEMEKHLKYQQDIQDHLLEAEGDRHVVIVQYIFPVPPQVEYVYNSVKPENQKIVWARWHGQKEASDFFEHYKDRKMWLLAVTADKLPELRPFKWTTQTAPVVPPDAPVSPEYAPKKSPETH